MTHRSGLVREPPIGHYFDDTSPSLDKMVTSLNKTELVYEPEKKTKPRMKTMITANSVHFSWWKLARMVLSIRGSFSEPATITGRPASVL